MKTLLLFVLACASAFAQNGPRFSATTGDASLVAAGTTLTLQRPAASGGPQIGVTLESAVVYCSVACNVTQAFNGTGASTTAATITPLPPVGASPVALAFSASNVGGGTAVPGILHLAAGQTAVIDVSAIKLASGGITSNYSFIISTITGTANITAIWAERQ